MQTVEPWHDFLLPSSSAGELEHECVILYFSQFGFEFVWSLRLWGLCLMTSGKKFIVGGCEAILVVQQEKLLLMELP